jgi:cytidine deaminase
MDSRGGTTVKKKKNKKSKKSKGSEIALLDTLVQRAKEVRKRAHAPYSRYFVGAAIATRSGRIFEGCNVENASYGGTICAERNAIVQMVAAGERDPIACAVVTEDGGSPCGICRQVLSEFATKMPIALVGVGDDDDDSDDRGHVIDLAELLPHAFILRGSKGRRGTPRPKVARSSKKKK